MSPAKKQSHQQNGVFSCMRTTLAFLEGSGSCFRLSLPCLPFPPSDPPTVRLRISWFGSVPSRLILYVPAERVQVWVPFMESGPAIQHTEVSPKTRRGSQYKHSTSNPRQEVNLELRHRHDACRFVAHSRGQTSPRVWPRIAQQRSYKLLV